MVNDDHSVLIIAGLGTQDWLRDRPSKLESHISPIAGAADDVIFVCPGAKPENVELKNEGNIEYYEIHRWNWKLAIILSQLLVSIRLSLTREFDLIVSYSLVPYGIFSLICGILSRTPTHLGVIGGDLDVHAEGSFGKIIQWLFRRFDIVTVAGDQFRQKMATYGVPPERIFTVFHPVSDEFSFLEPVENPEYDILWLTRVSEEKNPLMFVEILDELRNRSLDFNAALVGSGPLEEDVRRAVSEKTLNDNIDLPGWTYSPEEYYRNAKIYVMTSKREMLPLTLVEAMLVGIVPVVPKLGAIPDAVNHERNGVIVESKTINDFANAIEDLLINEDKRIFMAENAPQIESMMSHDAVINTWIEIFESF